MNKPSEKISSATITWGDLDLLQKEGSVRIGDWTVAVMPEHIERWQNDPDGRFKLCPVSPDGGSAQLGRFYPSL